MNLGALYHRFIESRQGRVFGPEEYSERHHIIPRCEGGGDEPENLIRLTARDHLFAHLILAKWKGGVHWASLFVIFGNEVKRGVLPSAQAVRLVAKAREAFGLHQSTALLGNQNSRGKRSKETRARMSAARKGNTNALGSRHSEETKARIAASVRATLAQKRGGVK